MELFASDGDRLAYKTKGLEVAANDRLRYCYHTARAIIENRNARLSDEDVKTLVSDIPQAGTFVRDHFKGLFFATGVHGVDRHHPGNIELPAQGAGRHRRGLHPRRPLEAGVGPRRRQPGRAGAAAVSVRAQDARQPGRLDPAEGQGVDRAARGARRCRSRPARRGEPGNQAGAGVARL